MFILYKALECFFFQVALIKKETWCKAPVLRTGGRWEVREQHVHGCCSEWECVETGQWPWVRRKGSECCRCAWVAETRFAWENILKYKTRTGERESLAMQSWNSVLSVWAFHCTCSTDLHMVCCMALLMTSLNRGKFLEMCDGLLARVEPPLRSVLEQASKCERVLPSALEERSLTGLLGVLTKLGHMDLA